MSTNTQGIFALPTTEELENEPGLLSRIWVWILIAVMFIFLVIVLGAVAYKKGKSVARKSRR